MEMPKISWTSHCIVPCPGDASCKHCKPGEPHPKQHTYRKLVHEYETITPKISPSLKSSRPPRQTIPTISREDEGYLRRRRLIGKNFGNLDVVPKDSSVDPPYYACFICWSLLHSTSHCQEPKTHIYCNNCGRKDIEVDTCPRCARAYREYRDKNRRFKEDERESRCEFSKSLIKSVSQLREEDLENGDSYLLKSEVKKNGEANSSQIGQQVKYQNDKKSYDGFQATDRVVANATEELKSASSEKLKQNNDSLLSMYQCCNGDDKSDSCNGFQNTDSNELFTFMRNQKMQNNELESDLIRRETPLNSFSETESEYYFYDDEDENYEDYVVDEDEKSESLYSEDYEIRFFVDLLDALKHLSIEMQNTVILNFVSARKKLIHRE